jgi:hypothetical protein
MDPFARIKVRPTHVFVTPGPANSNGNDPTSPLASATSPVPPIAVEDTSSKPQAETNGEKKNINAATYDDLFADVELDI